MSETAWCIVSPTERADVPALISISRRHITSYLRLMMETLGTSGPRCYLLEPFVGSGILNVLLHVCSSCFGFGSALAMPSCSCSCSTVENLAAHPPKPSNCLSIIILLFRWTKCRHDQILIYRFLKPSLSAKIHRLTRPKPLTVSRTANLHSTCNICMSGAGMCSSDPTNTPISAHRRLGQEV